MPFVVVAKFIHLMIPLLDSKEDIYFIKKKGPKGYFYYTGNKSLEELLSWAKRIVKEDLSSVYILDCYGLYNGMMDFVAYLPKEQKDRHPYYNNPKKELSDEEIEAFLVAKGLNYNAGKPAFFIDV